METERIAAQAGRGAYAGQPELSIAIHVPVASPTTCKASLAKVLSRQESLEFS